MIAAKRLVIILSWLLRAAASGRQLPPKGSRILMLSISQIEHDPRITKVARTMAEAGFEVDVMAPAEDDAYAEHPTDPGVRHVRVPRTWNWRLFLVYQDEFRRAGLKRQFDYVHANDLTTLTVAWVLARLRHVPLVYDAHELWTENVQPKGSQWVAMSGPTRLVARVWEWLLLRRVDLVVTVSPSIADIFKRRVRSNKAQLLLPNFPSLTLRTTPGTPTIREECGLEDSNFVTLYLGGVNPLRNIEGVIRAHAHLPETHVFVIRGPGIDAYADDYRELAASLDVEQRVFFLPPVEMDEVLDGAAGADCGVVMLRNICKNFYLFFPNKLFEYALAGLPVAVSDFPDVAAFVRDERCGVTFNPERPESIASALRALSSDREEARRMGARGRESILGGRNWEAASAELITAYRRIR